MTHEDKIEGNVLIAKFMGGTPYLVSMSPGAEERILIPMWGDCSLRISKPEAWADPSDEMRYHSDWNWLMPVLEKIIRVEIGDDVETVKHAFPRTFGMIDEETGKCMVRLNGFFLHKEDRLIDAAYSAIVEFINHYNTQRA